MFRLIASRTFFPISTRRLQRKLPFFVVTAVAIGAAVVTKPVVYLDAPFNNTTNDFVKDVATGIEFPVTLKIPSRTPLPEYTLLGVGARKVCIEIRNIVYPSFPVSTYPGIHFWNQGILSSVLCRP